MRGNHPRLVVSLTEDHYHGKHFQGKASSWNHADTDLLGHVTNNGVCLSSDKYKMNSLFVFMYFPLQYITHCQLFCNASLTVLGLGSHIWLVNWVNLGLDNGLVLIKHQAIIYTNADLSSPRCWWNVFKRNCSKIEMSLITHWGPW